MAGFTAIAAGAGVLTQGIGAIGAGRRARRARREAAQAQARLAAAERNRQAITNPFAGVQDLSDMISNPFANLQVATQAAEMQADEADISLANTLDTLRATGAGSAGATALAQAALRSKQGVAASIEQQEAANSRLRAQGEQRAQQMRMAEAQRLQQADVAGRQFMFQTREQREMQKLNRLAGLSTQAMVNAQSAQAQSTAALGALGGSLISFAGQAEEGNWFQKQSDRRLKQDIEFLRLSPSKLKIYSFKYKNQEGVYEGVMSDEVPKNAVIKNFKGIYDGVDYSKIDVQFKRIK